MHELKVGPWTITARPKGKNQLYLTVSNGKKRVFDCGGKAWPGWDGTLTVNKKDYDSPGT